MMSNNPHPEEVLEVLLKEASTRAKRSLQLIHKICAEQVDRGSKDLRLVTIGRLSEQEGGPSYNAIRNKGGERYRTLITAWMEQHSSPLKKAKPRLQEEDWIEEIPQLNIRWLIRDALQELKQLKNENNLLKSNLVLNVDLRESSGAMKPEGLISQPALKLSASEIRALQHAVSDQHLAEMGWVKDERGKIVDADSHQIFKPGFISAIEKALEIQE